MKKIHVVDIVSKKAEVPSFQGRTHAPGKSGFWIHPRKGTFTLEGTKEYHAQFVLDHPELFGIEDGDLDFDKIYNSGWISIRKFAGPQEMWAVAYSRLRYSYKFIERWAEKILKEFPKEKNTPVMLVPTSDPVRPDNITMEQISMGMLRFASQKAGACLEA